MIHLQSLTSNNSEFGTLLSSKSKTEETEHIGLASNFNSNYFSEASSNYKNSEFGLSSNTASVENHLLAKLKLDSERHSSYLMSIIIKEDFIEGETTATELYLTSLYKENPALLEECFQRTWLKLYQLSNPNVLANFISIVSVIDYQWLKDKADVLVLGGCCHYDEYVNEATLRAVEAWEEPSHISYLMSVRPFELPWLEDYRRAVISHIERMQ